MSKVIVENTSLGGRGIGDLILFPGQNPVEKSKWEWAKTHDSIMDQLENGELVEHAEVENENSLAEVPQKDAIKIAKTTYDLPRLDRMLAVEKRPAVAKALSDQIARIRSQISKTKSETDVDLTDSLDQI